MLRGFLFGFILAVSASSAARAQEAHEHHQPASEPGVTIPAAREGSGTSWLPDTTPMLAIHAPTRGGWEMMLHGVAFLHYLRDEAPRGHWQIGSINWLMGHARRSVGNGAVSLRGMLSLEPATVPGCGYPDLLASGENCDGRVIVDQQHPHDLVMEAAAMYVRPLTANVGLQLYGGLAGEPAMGPVAFPHRLSAVMNPLAPVSHHWLDATHITYGVLTGGVYGSRWKVEGSLFNGREPDDQRWDFDLAPLDSYSARVTLLPTPRWATQFSFGHLSEAEQHHGVRVDVDRVIASAIYHRPLEGAGFAATTAAWGRNRENGQATHAFLAESTVSFDDRNVFFGRGELAQKTGDELDLHHDVRVFTIGKLQAGYTHFLAPLRGWRPGFGASVSIGLVPASLRWVYGRRAPLGFGVFAVLRPAAMLHTATAATAATAETRATTAPMAAALTMAPRSPHTKSR